MLLDHRDYGLKISKGRVATAFAAFSAFTATNLDDIILLVLLFSRLNSHLKLGHVVSGQFLGISALVLVSLSGYLSRSVLPESWLGLLGLLPISLGSAQLIQRFQAGFVDTQNDFSDQLPALPLAGMLGVAGLTIANGSDNIGVYLPLFASDSASEIGITLLVFAVLTACWCQLAWWLTRAPFVATVLQRYGEALLPAVLIALGGVILHNSGTLQDQTLACIALISLIIIVASMAHQIQLLIDHRSVAGAP